MENSSNLIWHFPGDPPIFETVASFSLLLAAALVALGVFIFFVTAPKVNMEAVEDLSFFELGAKVTITCSSAQLRLMEPIEFVEKWSPPFENSSPGTDVAILIHRGQNQDSGG